MEADNDDSAIKPIASECAKYYFYTFVLILHRG